MPWDCLHKCSSSWWILMPEKGTQCVCFLAFSKLTKQIKRPHCEHCYNQAGFIIYLWAHITLLSLFIKCSPELYITSNEHQGVRGIQYVSVFPPNDLRLKFYVYELWFNVCDLWHLHILWYSMLLLVAGCLDLYIQMYFKA